MIIKNVSDIGCSTTGQVYLELGAVLPEEDISHIRVYVDNVNDIYIVNDSTVAIETPQPSAARK